MDTQRELVRRLTFDDSLYSDDRIRELALFGFVLSKSPDIIRCVFCNLQVRLCPLQDEDLILYTHMRLSPNCSLLLRRTTKNVAADVDLLNSLLPVASYDTVE